MWIVGNFLVFIIGLFLLVWGSNFLIQSSVKLAFLFSLTPLFIGIILIAFGTSAPELLVGVVAAVKNQKAIALGNIIGSNISNIGLILGLCASIRALKIKKEIFKKQLPIMLFSVGLLYGLSWDLVLSRIDGLIFLVIFFIFCFVTYREAKGRSSSEELKDFKFNSLFKHTFSKFTVSVIALFFLGVVIIGANLMVNSAVNLAKFFGISPWVIGITVFAIGTSLPELAASLTATVKKVSSISIGNIVGSNIFNILFVLGVVALIKPITIGSFSILLFEMPILILFTLGVAIFMRTGFKISRTEGLILLLSYISFIVFLISK